MSEIIQFPARLEHPSELTVIDDTKSLVIADEIIKYGEPWAHADANTAKALIRIAKRVKQA